VSLFGTDGVRGTAGVFPLDRDTIRRIGAALAQGVGGVRARILLGRDTRESGPWIEAELARGARSQGADVVTAGVVPTPAVAYLARHLGYSLGVVISASHNPYRDNGIKVFTGGGEKFGETLERQVEQRVADTGWSVPAGETGPVTQVDLRAEYLAHLRTILSPGVPLSGVRLVVDCAHGATSSVAPELFREIGVDLDLVGCAPDGRNINDGVGSTAPSLLARTVVARGARLGVAFDGDGDRAIFADAAGHVVDGDAVMLMCARQMHAEGRLRGGAIVATVMSNIGLELALKEAGIGLIRCPVGDKHVMEALLARGLSLGGEQSGHVIFADDLFTGDGLATSLHVLRTMLASGRELADLASDLTTYPQVLVNVRVPRRIDLASVPAIAAAMSDVESRLAGHGRLLVRYSGTEPLLRIMLEGRDQAEIGTWADEIAAAVRRHFDRRAVRGAES